MRQRIWIIGSSSGIGLELVKSWLLKDYNVIASAREATTSKSLLALKEHYDKSLILVDIDVINNASIDEAVTLAWSAFDGIDIWFYNAGAYEVMSTKEWDIKHFQTMMEVNYMGIVRVMTQLLPYFQAQKGGKWIWNASLSSYFGLPHGGGYSASKSAMVNLAQSLQPELLAQNIALQIINHGFVKTRLTDKNDFAMPEMMSPHEASKNIIKAIEKPYRFEIHFPFKLSFVLRLLALLPYRLSLALTKKTLPK